MRENKAQGFVLDRDKIIRIFNELINQGILIRDKTYEHHVLHKARVHNNFNIDEFDELISSLKLPHELLDFNTNLPKYSI